MPPTSLSAVPMTLSTGQPWLNSYAAVEAEIRQLLQVNEALSDDVRKLESEMAVARYEQEQLTLRLLQLQEEQQAAQQRAITERHPPEAPAQDPGCGTPAVATLEAPPEPNTIPTPGTEGPPPTPEPQAQPDSSPGAQPVVAQQPSGGATAGEEQPPEQPPADARGPPATEELSEGAIKNKLVQVGSQCAFINTRHVAACSACNLARLWQSGMLPHLTRAPRLWQRHTGDECCMLKPYIPYQRPQSNTVTASPASWCSKVAAPALHNGQSCCAASCLTPYPTPYPLHPLIPSVTSYWHL